MEILATRRIGVALAMAVSVVFSVGAWAQGMQPMQPFTTDGCSLFPDRSLISKADWCSCCVAHDLAYWRGGTALERLKADQDLKACVLAASGSAELADLMFAGVQMGGGPYFFTPYRWGYGWPMGRLYRPLSADEDAQASSLRAKYTATHPILACPTETGQRAARSVGPERVDAPQPSS